MVIATVTEQVNGSEVLTNSSISTFKACRRKYYFAYELGWRPTQEVDVLRFGTIMHEAIDGMACGKYISEITDWIREQYFVNISNSHQDNIQSLEYECETAVALTIGYHAAWQNSQVTILESEKPFRLPINNPASSGSSQTFVQGGKRDRILRLPDGRLALGETKTTSEDIGPGSDYRNVLSLNSQICMYVQACKAEGIEVDTVIYDCIRKPSIRPSQVALTDENGDKIVLDLNGNRVMTKQGKPRQTGSTEDGYTLQTRDMTPEEWAAKLTSDIQSRPEYYFQRFEVNLLETDLEQFNEELWAISKDVLTCRGQNRWYRNTNSCRNYNRLCQYYGLCSGQVDCSCDVPEGFERVDSVHQELMSE